MSDKSYNGWTNYETWNLALWMDNDEGSYAYAREQAREAIKNARESGPDDTPKENRREAEFLLEVYLRSEWYEAMPDLGVSVWADLLGSALENVNFREIAEHLISEIWDDLDNAGEK